MTEKGLESSIVLYEMEGSKVIVSVRYQDEDFWLTQKAIAEMFDTTVQNINMHIKNILDDGELEEDSTIKDFLIVQTEGTRTVQRTVQFCNLDMVIAVGYRINSKQATRFRRWATKTLHEYIEKGYVLNDEMLKNGRPFGKDYFDELLERIREIRASERRAYQKIADIFEQASYDYDKSSQTTKDFYAFVQNKLHYAITGKTAAELLYERASVDHPTMGLTNWKGSPEGKIFKSDVVVAKNYLNEKELGRLNRIVTMFIDHAELMAEDQVPMSMEDWLIETDSFLKGVRRQVLESKGLVSHAKAVGKVEAIYNEFRVRQDSQYISEFDKDMAKYLTGNNNEGL
ncbi:MAG: virulence RhuM family protein [Eggerthellaceae bacterium]|nr:virulence RhuM family protein [Eggerthellaceae bacterium]